MQHRLQSRPNWQIALLMTAALRVFYTALAAAAAVFVHPQANLIRSNALTAELPTPGGWHYAWLGIWERFDTLWYLRIAAHGYDLPAAVVFYPLYPWLIRQLSWMVEPIFAALFISTLAAFFYFCGLLRLAQSDLPDRCSFNAVLLAAIWPASFFLFAGYTEALAAALIVWALACARDEQWLTATACAVAAGLTRSVGTLLIIPLLIMAWRAGGIQSKKKARFSVLLAPLGTVAYWLWLRQTGRPSIAAAYRIYWHTEVAAPWKTLWQAIRSLFLHFDFLVLVSLVALTVFLMAGVMARRRTEDRSFSAAILVHLLLRMCWPPLFGTPRYLLPVYPAFLTMAQWMGKNSRTRFIFLCTVLFAFNLVWMWAFLRWSLVL